MYKGKDVVCLAIDANTGEIGTPPAKDAKPAECYTDIRKHLEKGTSPETVEKAVTKADAARAADGKRPSLTMPAAAATAKGSAAKGADLAV
jgi:hypothetical protein